MSAPWFKFFPANWRADPALRMCSIAARGLWMEMICVMHEAVPRGSLIVNGSVVNERQVAALAGVTIKETVVLLSELETAGVFSRDANGTIFSRRMRRDDEKAERDKANGRTGGNPHLKGVNPPLNGQGNPSLNGTHNGTHKGNHNEPDKAKILEARSKKESTSLRSGDPAFEKFWAAYPRRKGANPSKPAQDRFTAAVRSGADPDAIIAAVARYASELSVQGKLGTEFVAQATTWLNQRRWQDYDQPVDAAISMGSRHWIALDSPEWSAWSKHRGKPFPLDTKGGWTAPSQWPPADDASTQRQTEAAE